MWLAYPAISGVQSQGRINLDFVYQLGLREYVSGSWEVQAFLTVPPASGVIVTLQQGFTSQSDAFEYINDILPGVGV